MSTRRTIAAALYGVTGLVTLALAAVYLFRSSFMPYHAEALGRGWAELDPALQTLLLALMKVAGAGWAALGFLTLVLVAFPIRRGERWARYAVPATLLGFYALLLTETLDVATRTPGSPPWSGNLIACGAVMLGFLLDAPWRDD